MTGNKFHGQKRKKPVFRITVQFLSSHSGNHYILYTAKTQAQQPFHTLPDSARNASRFFIRPQNLAVPFFPTSLYILLNNSLLFPLLCYFAFIFSLFIPLLFHLRGFLAFQGCRPDRSNFILFVFPIIYVRHFPATLLSEYYPVGSVLGFFYPRMDYGNILPGLTPEP